VNIQSAQAVKMSPWKYVLNVVKNYGRALYV